MISSRQPTTTKWMKEEKILIEQRMYAIVEEDEGFLKRRKRRIIKRKLQVKKNEIIEMITGWSK